MTAGSNLQGAGFLGFVGLAIALQWQGGQILQAVLLILFILTADQVISLLSVCLKVPFNRVRALNGARRIGLHIASASHCEIRICNDRLL